MKKILLFAATAFIFFQSTAQQTNGHFSFTWTMQEDGELSKTNVEMYSSPKYFAIYSEENEIGSEKAIVDRTGKNGIEFFSDVYGETERDNYYSAFSWEESIGEAAYISQVFSGIMTMPDFNDGLELLPEKSTIAGISCQKFKIVIPEAEATITGWIAVGKHCLISDEYYFLDTEKGMILELNMNFVDSSLEVKCTGYDAKFPETSPVYSMAIPEGYTSLEGDENYPDEEGSDGGE